MCGNMVAIVASSSNRMKAFTFIKQRCDAGTTRSTRRMRTIVLIVGVVATGILSLAFLLPDTATTLTNRDQYERLFSISSSSSNTTISSPARTFQQIEQQARLEQREFCTLLASNRVPIPDLGSEEDNRTVISMQVKQVQIQPLFPGQSEAFTMNVYDNTDIVSQNIIQFGAWESTATSEMAGIFREYSSQHNISLNALTFVDIGANVGCLPCKWPHWESKWSPLSPCPRIYFYCAVRCADRRMPNWRIEWWCTPRAWARTFKNAWRFRT